VNHFLAIMINNEVCVAEMEDKSVCESFWADRDALIHFLLACDEFGEEFLFAPWLFGLSHVYGNL